MVMKILLVVQDGAREDITFLFVKGKNLRWTVYEAICTIILSNKYKYVIAYNIS